MSQKIYFSKYMFKTISFFADFDFIPLSTPPYYLKNKISARECFHNL